MTLLKIQLMSFFGINEIRYSKDSKKRRSLIIVGVSIILVGIFIGAYSAAMAYGLVSMGMMKIIPAYMLMLISVITLIMTIFKTNGILFGFKDYDMVMSLPVTTSTVITSRFMMMYVLNFLFECVVIIPASIIYAINIVPEASYYIMMLISIFIIPLIPMTIATAIGAIITAISCRFKYKNLFSILMSFGLILGLFYLSMSSKNLQVEDVASLSSYMLEQINRTYPIARIFTEAICNYNILAFAAFVFLSVSWFYVFIKIVSWKYKEMNTALTNHATKRNYKMQSLEISSPFMALYRKELKRYFSSTIYVMNTGFGVVLLLIATIFIAIFGVENLESITSLPGLSATIYSSAPFIIATMIATSCTTASAISLEGKNLWILKSSPIKAKTIFDSKIAVNLTILIPTVIASGIVLAIRLKLGIIGILLIFITPIVYSFYVAIVGIFVNLKFPNFDWTSETVAIKQSGSTLISMIVQMLSVMIPFGLIFIMSKELSNYIVIGSTVIIATLAGVLYSYISRQKI
jgi:ABC-2 type transport system permease protein